MCRLRMEAWIEISKRLYGNSAAIVASVWRRGLKYLCKIFLVKLACRLRMEAWIEIQVIAYILHARSSRLRMEAWIEIVYVNRQAIRMFRSPPYGGVD